MNEGPKGGRSRHRNLLVHLPRKFYVRSPLTTGKMTYVLRCPCSTLFRSGAMTLNLPSHEPDQGTLFRAVDPLSFVAPVFQNLPVRPLV